MCKKIKVHQASQERNQLSPRKLLKNDGSSALFGWCRWACEKNNGHWAHQSGQWLRRSGFGNHCSGLVRFAAKSGKCVLVRNWRRQAKIVSVYLLKHEVGTLEMDMTERSLVLSGSTSKPRNIDLYVAGYPCPSFSALGRKRGGLDPRGVVPLYGLQWIIKEQPKACILENMAGRLHVKLSTPCAPIRRHCCFSWKRLWKAFCKQTWRSAIF